MPQTVTQRPDQYNAWVATGNPILYKLQRKDYATTVIANSGGALQITVTGNLATLAAALGGPVVAGSTLWFTDANGVYNSLFTVVTCTNAASSVVTFTVGTYTSGAGAVAGYVNLISNRPAWRLEVDLYRQTNNAVIFSSLYTSPTSAGLTTVDVSILNEYVNSDITPYLIYGKTNYTQATPTYPYLMKQCFDDDTAPKYLGFYIKYRETWTGSAESQTDDVANPSFAVKAARQIGEAYGGYLKEFSDSNRAFLTRFTYPRMWTGRPFSLSFIEPTGSASNRTLIKKTFYNENGLNLGSIYILPNMTGAINRRIYEVYGDTDSRQSLMYDTQFNAAGTAWTNLGSSTLFSQVVLTPAGASRYLAFPVLCKSGLTYSFIVNWQTAGAGAETVTITALLVALNQVTVVGTSALAAVGPSSRLDTFSFTPSADAYWLFLDIQESAGVNNRTNTVYQVTWVTVPPTGTTVKTIGLEVVHRDDAAMSETAGLGATLCPVHSPCENVVQLFWQNSRGGESNWCFDYSQEYTYRYNEGQVRKRMILFANNLTANEWEGINELNTIGEIYKTPITELTSTINKTHRRRGAQVYMVDSTGAKTYGVIVIPTENRSETKRKKHVVEVTIELPEIQAAR